MHSYYVSLIRHFTPWNIPTPAVLINTLRAKFPTDDFLTVVPMRGAEQGNYKVVVSEPIPEVDLFVQVMVEKTKVDLPLITDTEYLAHKRGGMGNSRAEGLLITLYNCTHGPLHDVTNACIDRVLAAHGVVTRPTEYQRNTGTQVWNGNRFCVLNQPKPELIPDFISVQDPKKPDNFFRIYLGFKGKLRMCSRCLKKHANQCPELLEFYNRKDARKETTITSKFLSDSTLRYADETGLSSDITCMSGARIGNITHAILDDPSMKVASQIVVVAGQNDLLRDDESLETFKSIMHSSIHTLRHTVYATKAHLTMVQPLLPSKDVPLRNSKAEWLHDTCLTSTTDVHLPMQYIYGLNVEMDGIHPTVQGTKKFLQLLHSKLNMIADARFITDKQLYRGVKSVFCYGCLFCHKYLDLDRTFLCSECGPKLPSQEAVEDGSLGPHDNKQPEPNVSLDFGLGVKRPQHDNLPPTTPKKIILEAGELADDTVEVTNPKKIHDGDTYQF